MWQESHVGILLIPALTVRILYAYTIGIFSKTIPGFWYKGELDCFPSLEGLVSLLDDFDISIAAYAGALLSYAIVVSKSLGFPQLNRAYLQKAMMEDNAQYGFMAVYWFLSKPLYSMYSLAQSHNTYRSRTKYSPTTVSLLPFATFSFFHCLTFFRGTLLPKMFTA